LLEQCGKTVDRRIWMLEAGNEFNQKQLKRHNYLMLPELFLRIYVRQKICQGDKDLE
jgi:hypothetical protein